MCTCSSQDSSSVSRKASDAPEEELPQSLLDEPTISLANEANWGLLVGRILLGSIFFFCALAKLATFSNTAELMHTEGIVYADFYLCMAIILEMLGSLALFTGICSRTAAIVLFFYLVPVTFMFHDFWSLPLDENHLQLSCFLKNLAIMGGLLTAAASGPGPFCLNPGQRHTTSVYDSTSLRG